MASDDDPVIGKVATVVHRISPGHRGEVVVHIRGGTEVYMAVSDTSLEANEQVVVIGQLGPRTVQVAPFLSSL